MPPSKQGKKPQQPPREQPTQSSSKGKQPERLPVEDPIESNPGSEKPRQLPPDESIQPNTKGKKSQLPLREQSTQSTSKGKQPVPSAVEEPIQSKPGSEKPQQPPLDQSTQPSTTSKDYPQRPGEQSTEGTSKGKGKQPVRPPVEEPLQANPGSEKSRQPPLDQSMQPSTKRKRPHQPSREQPTQSTSKGTQTVWPPVEEPMRVNPGSEKSQQRPGEQSTEGTSKGQGKQAVRLPVEEPIQAIPRSEKPRRPPVEEPIQANPGSEKSQPRPGEQSTGGTSQGSSKGKQPVRPPREQPVQAGPSSEEPPQPSLGQSARPGTKGQKWRKPPSTQPDQGDSKGEQPARKPVRGNPRCHIARIPVGRDGGIKRVKVYIAPATAFRHPQTFFFKNLPNVDPYWGWLNDAASSAQRIVRLYRGDEPVSYFLLACRGEWPKPTSPRNDNAVFAGMHEPIFGDAFVFRLGDPELYENGYARYVHIEEDIGSVDWLPKAIRDAARKVEHAMAAAANAGFPDTMAYADKETMINDAKRMIRWLDRNRKADRKYGNIMSGLADPKKMEYALEKMRQNVNELMKDGFLPYDSSTTPPQSRTVEEFAEKARNTIGMINVRATDVNAARDADEPSSASKNLESSDLETTDELKGRMKSFRVARNAYNRVEAIGIMLFALKLLGVLKNSKAAPVVKTRVAEQKSSGENSAAPVVKTRVDEQKNSGESSAAPVSGSLTSEVVGKFIQKIEAVYQGMEESDTQSSLASAIGEATDIFKDIYAGIKQMEVAKKAEA